MKTNIIKFEDNKIEILEDNEVKEYELEDWVKKEFVKTGPADVSIANGKVTFVNMYKLEDLKKEVTGQANTTSKTTPAIKTADKIDTNKKSDIVNIKGKDFMTYAGLLKMAHKKGNFSITITESWVSEDMKKAWCKVRLTAGEQTIDGFGSSTPDNTGAMTEHYPIEMAHTRAKGRALRDYLNIGQAMAEEIKQ